MAAGLYDRRGIEMTQTMTHNMGRPIQMIEKELTKTFFYFKLKK